jgi:peptide/nickel transport system substrate-binding protein
VLRHIRWQIALIFIGVLMLGGLMAYLASAYTVQREPAPGGTYVEGMAGAPQYLNPLLCQYNDVDQDLCALIFSGLVRYDEHGVPQPDLAESWEISADGLTYTFHLRPDARWHDNQPVTAADVVFTLSLLQDPNFLVSPNLSALWRTVKVEEVNSLTVQMTLHEPLAPFLQYVATDNFGVLPKHALPDATASNLADQPFNRKPIGTGPFQLEDIGNGETGQPPFVLLSAFPGYFGRQPYIAKIDFKFYPDFPALLSAYRAGEVQGINRIAPDQLTAVRDIPSLNLFTAPTAAYSMIFLNQGDDALPFFQEQALRQALLLSLDRKRLVEEVLHGQGIVADNPFIPGTWAYANDLPPIVPNGDQARHLLSEAGWRFPVPPPLTRDDSGAIIAAAPVPTLQANEQPIRVKNGIPLSFTLYTNNNPLQVALAKAIARQWLDVGVKATVVPVQAGLVSNYLAPRAYQAALVDVQLTSDPDPYPFWHETQADIPGQNYSQFRDRDISEALEQARRTDDLATRTRLYHKFQELFREKIPGILLYYPVYNYGVSEKVTDVQIGPIAFPADRFRNLSDWYVITRRVIKNEAALKLP